MSRFLWVFVFVIGGWGIGGDLAVGQQVPALPSQSHSGVQAQGTMPVEQLPSVDAEALREEDRRQRGRITPYRYGTTQATNITPRAQGTWDRLPSGEWLWRVRIESPEAQSVSLGFRPFEVPSGARLFVHGGAGEVVRGPYTYTDATDGQHRTPQVPGAEAVVELVVPAGQRGAVNLAIRTVVHGYRSIRPSGTGGGLAKSGSCNLDVACNEADPWRRQVRAAGLYSFESGGYTYTCSGSLVNNTAENERPFFLTAEHCISTASEAESMVFYWNYQNSTCREQGTTNNGSVTADDRGDQTSTGAVLRARYGNYHNDGRIAGRPDLALVEVDDVIPDRYNLFFSGWSRAGQATAEAATIHHPSGDGKRISFDQQPTDVTAYGGTDGSGDTHLRVGNWDVGTTERGSSGSPLYNAEEQVVGVLSGGIAGCVSGTSYDNDEPDWYGRIAPGFTSGDYTPPGFTSPATLADWLDPLNTGTQTLAGRPQQAQPVMGAPTNLTATTTRSGYVSLDWSVPDSLEEVGYRLYRSTAPIDSTIVTRSVYTPIKRISTGTTTVVDSTVRTDTPYAYRVTALDATAYEGAFSNEAAATVTVPSVALVDGRDGRAYDPPAPEPGTDRNPVGRFVLHPDETGATLDSVAVDTDGDASGVTAAELWTSTDATFDPGEDTSVGTDQTPSSITFGSLGAALPAESTYVFVTVDLADEASGTYAPLLENASSIVVTDGAVASVNGTTTRSFSDAYLSSTSNTLPVELARFDATVQEESVALAWTTASETNNAGFRVQRRPSGDPSDHNASWTTVGTVEGAGTTTESQRYRLMDDDLPYDDEALAYRLKQVDTDGTAHYSETVTVQRRVEAVQLLGTFPNPARRRITVRYALPTRQPVALHLYDVLGRRVKTIVDGSQSGRKETTVDVSDLSNGVYVLRLRAEDGVRTQKVVIVQ